MCGFANAEGGALVIGRNDKGQRGRHSDAAKLLEELPNKIRDLLGIVVEVNLRTKGSAEFVEIVTPAYPSPISYRGHYYQRSGSTLQELKGAALDRFLLRRYGRHWDDVPVPGVTPRSLSKAVVDAFRARARESQRVAAADLKESAAGLMEKLHLWDGTHLEARRGAGLSPGTGTLRHRRPGEDRLLPQQRRSALSRRGSRRPVHPGGSDRAIAATKYLKAAITYKGIQRVETYPVPGPALREALLNAVIHKDYATGVPVQISVYDDKLMIWNPGQLPPSWTVEKLTQKHASHPFNPDLANVFFRAGDIEAWGRGIERIVAACRAAGCPEPVIAHDATGLWVTFAYSAEYLRRIEARG